MGYKYNPFTGNLDLVDASTIPPDVARQFDTDSGTAIPSANVINFLGDATQGISSSGAGNTVTYTVTDATESQKGVSELATDAEAIAGTDSVRTIVPTSLKAKLGVQTANGVPYGAGDTSAVSWTSALTDGQLVIGSTAGNPAPGAITSTGSTIVVTLGSNTINLETGSTVPVSFTTDSGSAVPEAGVLQVLGGTGCATAGATNVVTINLDAEVPLSFPTDSGTATPAANALTVAGGTLLSSAGSGSTVTLNADDNVVGSVAGDSGTVTPTSNSFTIAGGTLLSSSGSGATLTVNADDNVVGSVITDSGTATPASNAFTIAGGTNCSTSASGSTVTINATGSPLPVTEVTTTSDSLVANNAYIANNAGLVTLTLPATAALGTIIEVLGKGAGGWSIAQNAGQTMHVGSNASTTGAGGSVASSNQWDSIKLMCVTADTDWSVLGGPQGNLTVT